MRRVNSNQIPLDESGVSNEERIGLTLLAEAEAALREVVAGQGLSSAELDRLLSD